MARAYVQLDFEGEEEFVVECKCGYGETFETKGKAIDAYWAHKVAAIKDRCG